MVVEFDVVHSLHSADNYIYWHNLYLTRPCNILYDMSAVLLQFYHDAVDMMVTSHTARLLFVRKRQQDNTFKYSDYFGVDVWNMSTHTKYVHSHVSTHAL